MKPQISPGSLRNRIANISRGWLCGRDELSGRPALKQLLPNARSPKSPQRTPGPEFFLADLLDVNSELPYTTVVEGLEEFLYQSELQLRVINTELARAVCLR